MTLFVLLNLEFLLYIEVFHCVESVIMLFVLNMVLKMFVLVLVFILVMM